MRCDSASSSTNPTVRRGQSIICLPLAYYHTKCRCMDTSTALPTLHQIWSCPPDLHQVCSVQRADCSVQYNPTAAQAACANRHRQHAPRVKTKTMRQSGRCPTIQSPDLYLDPHNVTLHSLTHSPTHPHTHTSRQATHRNPTSEFLSRACALHHAGRPGARLNSPSSWPVTAGAPRNLDGLTT